MACTSCSTSKSGKPKGCKSNGGCDTGGCNKLNTYDWLSTYEFDDPTESKLVEVSFRNGAHKSFFYLKEKSQAETGDIVTVDADGGYDVGIISLKGPLAQLQVKKKSVKIETVHRQILRTASEIDLQKLNDALKNNKTALVRSRSIARSLGLDMKIGDVDYRADGKKVTFYYTAEGRVDFRELIKIYAKEFRVKIEMRQIGSRQESSRIGGLGSCGRELCCSTWLSDFKSVSTNAARYQNLAINQAKLSGQCGRLKCCLNYELDVYIEALSDFPTDAETLKYATGIARLIKTDIFKKQMYYIIKDDRHRDEVVVLSVNQASDILKQIEMGNIPEKITGIKVANLEDEIVFSNDLTGHIELPDEKKRKNNRKKSGNNDARNRNQNTQRSPTQNTLTKQNEINKENERIKTQNIKSKFENKAPKSNITNAPNKEQEIHVQNPNLNTQKNDPQENLNAEVPKKNNRKWRPNRKQ